MDWLYQFTTNYGLALILFSLIVKIVLLPLNAKSKKSMLKMSRIAPLQKALEAKYGDDKAKYQQELMALYKEEGVSTTGGCLWAFIPLLILLPLYYVIREPITYMLHFSAEQAAQIVEIVGQHVSLGASEYFHQLIAASHLGEFAQEIADKLARGSFQHPEHRLLLPGHRPLGHPQLEVLEPQRLEPDRRIPAAHRLRRLQHPGHVGGAEAQQHRGHQ